MAYRLGSHGEEVVRIQQALKARGLYLGPLDGDFGGGTESGVKALQTREALPVTGVVDAATWARLYPNEPMPEPAIARAPLDYRCLALTAGFETGAPAPECFAGLSGDFDGQGLSFGALQWNLGQGTLQALLVTLDQRSPAVLDDVFHEHAPTIRGIARGERKAAVQWARSVQDPKRHVVAEPWRGIFKTLGRRPECQQVQVALAADRYRAAMALCRDYGVWSERAAALMFDVKVQNGSIRPKAKAQIAADVQPLGGASGPDDEVARLKAIANRVAESSAARWVEDVRARKLAIAVGHGRVHGRPYDLEDQYGIRLEKASGLPGPVG